METIPNHVMMMSGLRPDRTGVPANVVYDRELGETRTLDRPRDLKREDRASSGSTAAGFTTATVLSKEYLVGIFGKRATYRWVPDAYIPVSDHAPDVADDGRDAVDGRGARPQPGVRQPRRRRPGRPHRLHRRRGRAARAAGSRWRRTDRQVGRLVDQLQAPARGSTRW